MFTLNRNDVKYKFSGPTRLTSSDKVPLFEKKLKSKVLYYSYVDWETVKIKPVKLSVDNFVTWFGFNHLDINNLIEWQNQHRVLLRFYKTTNKVDYRDGLTRSNCPGDLKPKWKPRMILYLLITDFPFTEFILTTQIKYEPVKCGKPGCGFKASRPSTIEAHRSQCRNYTEIKSKQISYGKPLPSMAPSFKLCVFDIETLEEESPKDNIEATLKLLSIGVATNLNGYESRYFVRNSSRMDSGQSTVNQFMDYLMILKNKYEKSLPKALITSYEDLCIQIESCENFHESRKLYAEKSKLQSLMSLPIFGFNSSKFDLKVLVPYLVKYAQNNGMEKDVKVLKKGANYFSFCLGNLEFKDILSYTAPCSLDKFFQQWYSGPLKKGIFPYQRFSSIEELRSQTTFPLYDEFYSSLKSSNVSQEDYESSRKEFYRRLNLSADDSRKMFSMADWLEHYQMLDVVPLVLAIEKCFQTFYLHFRVNPMEKKSLPSIAFTAAFNLFDQSMPHVYSFQENFDDVRQLFRDNQVGGLCNLFHRHINLEDQSGPMNTRFAPNGHKFTYFSFYDFNSLYLWAQDQPMPLSPGLLWEKRTNQFYTKRPMTQGVSKSQLEWLMWLQLQPFCLDNNGQRQRIHHAFYQGEKKVSGLQVDGYLEKNGKVYFLEFFGCYWHSGCCVTDKKIGPRASERRFKDKRKLEELSKIGEVIVMRECQWEKMKAEIRACPTEMSRIFENDNESSLLLAIQKEEVFGFVVADVETPESLIDSFGSFLFPPVIKRLDIKSEMLSPYMKQLCDQELINVDKQDETIVQTYNGKQLLLITSMAKLYMDRGIIVKNITKFVQVGLTLFLFSLFQYIPGRALDPFVQKVVKMRTEAKRTGDEAKSLTAKLFGNSSYGKMGEAVSRYRKTNITTDDSKALKSSLHALCKSDEQLIAEGDLIGHELSSLKREQDDSKPVHLAVAILQNAKLLFLR